MVCFARMVTTGAENSNLTPKVSTLIYRDAVAPIMPISKPSFSPVFSGVPSIYMYKWQLYRI